MYLMTNMTSMIIITAHAQTPTMIPMREDEGIIGSFSATYSWATKFNITEKLTITNTNVKNISGQFLQLAKRIQLPNTVLIMKLKIGGDNFKY